MKVQFLPTCKTRSIREGEFGYLHEGLKSLFPQLSCNDLSVGQISINEMLPVILCLSSCLFVFVASETGAKLFCPWKESLGYFVNSCY